jgi:hypothetical protein
MEHLKDNSCAKINTDQKEIQWGGDEENTTHLKEKYGQ